ncbi:hypothetical protein BLNAU_24895 [Blattamonas nauphoetae]|uniref:HAT C-terminal dimerisation domain-containing protein n=1 Tax=Blattamonas nauphoetae TaxID=2049346 RepID=A0ABQ9WL56_9EUKA|nr:hypothetical protein BLNAU_24895 [Blattamonas nauphoetae]
MFASIRQFLSPRRTCEPETPPESNESITPIQKKKREESTPSPPHSAHLYDVWMVKTGEEDNSDVLSNFTFSDEGALCRICSQFYCTDFVGNRKYVKIPGDPRYPSNLRSHLKSQRHLHACEQSTPCEFPSPPIEKESLGMVQLVAQRFMDAWFVAKNNLSNSMFEQLVRHIDSRSRPAQNSSVISSRYHYRSLIRDLDEYFTQKHVDAINKAEMFAIMVDAGVDSSGTKLFSVLLRYIFNNEIRTIHCGLSDLNCAATGLVQFTELQKLVTDFGLDIQKSVSICTDGDRSLTGIRTGLVAHLKNQNQNLISFHCSPHQVQLAIKHGPRKEALRDQQRLHSLSTNKISVPNETRWISKYRCCHDVARNYNAIKGVITKEEFHCDEQLVNRICDRFFQPKLSALTSILQIFSSLTTKLQHHSITFPQMIQAHQVAIDAIQIFSSGRFFEHLAQDESTTLRGEFEIFRALLETELSSRMEIPTILKHFAILDPMFSPPQQPLDFGISFESLLTEWELFRGDLTSPKLEHQSFTDVLTYLGSSKYESFTGLQILARIARTIVVTTVPVEASFSLIRWMKTVQRSRLLTDHLSQELRVKYNSEDHHSTDDFLHLAENWIKHHYITQTRNSSKQALEEAFSDSD